MSKRRLSVSAERTIYTYSYLHSAALQGIEQAENSEEGAFYNCMSSVVLSAFCIEAYLNHVACRLLPYWDDEVERTLNVHSKLKIISDRVDVELDFSRRPFQSFNEVMKFRNLLAHGKTTTIEKRDNQRMWDGKRISYPDAWWEEHSTLEFAKRWRHDIEAIIEKIHQSAGLGTSAFGIHSIGTASGRLSE